MAVLLGLTLSRTREVLEFLVSVGLCDENAGKYTIKEVRTHIEKSSPLSGRHHMNWRVQAMNQFENLSSSELAFTAPLTISKADAKKVHTQILELISRVGKTVADSPSEDLFCFNIDWFRVAGQKG